MSTEGEYKLATEQQICSNREPIQRHTATSSPFGSSNDFLEQIEVLDDSGLVTSLLQDLESIKRSLHKNKERIDIVTRECIVTEFLKRTTGLVNGQMETCNYGLIMEDKI